jgi:hypothetical protein
VVSDASWKWSTGAITFNCVRGGETIDAREDKPGWSLAGYDDSTWSAAVVVDRPAGKLVSQQHPAIRATAAIRPVGLTEPMPGVHVFDLGVNISGWARLTTRGPQGNGRDDLAYTLLTQEDFPGWLHMINNGATSIWEAWNGEASRNHPTLGCIGVWFYQGLGGIRRDPATPAFKRIVIKPAVVGDLTWVKCSHQSPCGKIESNWRREAGKLRLEVTIPPNTTATVFVPTGKSGDVTESGQPAANAKGVKFLRPEKDAAVYEVGSGSYVFEVSSPPAEATQQ